MLRNKKYFLSLFIAVVLIATSISTAYALPYAPGETLDPTCHPGDANCNVIIPSFTVGGDLSGTSKAQTVIGLQGNPVSSSTPASNQVLAWNGSAWAPANPASGSQWSNVSGGISYNSGNVTIDTTVLPHGVPVSVKASRFGAAGDARQVTDGAINVGTNNKLLTSATAAFAASDIGKTIVITGAGAAGANLSTTITSVISSTSVMLTVAASMTVSGATVVLGTDDTAAINSAISYLQTVNRGSLYFPSGQYLITGEGLNLDRIQSQGVQLSGDGPGRSVIYVTGSIGLNFLGTNEMAVRDLGIGGVNAGVGVLLGRYTDDHTNGQGRFENVHVNGTFRTAAVYNISAESVIWSNVWIQNWAPARGFYTSSTNDLNVTLSRGTIDTVTDVQNTFIGSHIQTCAMDAASTAVEVHGNVSVFGMFNSYIGTNGKGFYRSASDTNEYSGTVNIIGGGIENCVANGVSTVYWPVYFDGDKFDHVTIQGLSIYQTSISSPHPGIYQADGGEIDGSSFLNIYTEGTGGGPSFYNLRHSTVQTLYPLAIRHDAYNNNLSAYSITISGTDIGFNIKKAFSPGSMAISGAVNIDTVSATTFIGKRSAGTPNYPDIYGGAVGICLANAATHETQICLQQGKLIMTGIPTSSAGLTSGMVWNNGGVLTVVP